MGRKVKKILILLTLVIMNYYSPIALANSIQEETEEKMPSINYQTHVQDVGWQDYKRDGEMAGTEGKSLRLEGIKIQAENINVKYQVHIQDVGWQEWKTNNEMAGTEGRSLRLEGIKIDLDKSANYSVMYRVHVQDIGWQDWKIDGEMAGTEGKSKRLEGIEIKIIEKDTEPHVRYQTHVQDIGWQQTVKDGTLSGTEGKSLRLEALKINATNIPEGARIKYKTHVENIGWQEWRYDGELSGTEGQSLRLEGVRIELENMPNYSVQYRTHVQGIGWQDWANDGEMSGTEGKSLRLEAVEIKIVPKIENKIRMVVDTSIEPRIGQEQYKIEGWLMTDIADAQLQLLVNDEVAETQITRIERLDVIEAVKGYGGEEKNPQPGFQMIVDFSAFEIGETNLKIQAVDKDGNVLAEKTAQTTIYPKIERIEGIYGESGLKVAGKGGSDLPYLKYGHGENVFFATFAIHGYEDLWEKDGQELVNIANQFYNKLISDKDYELAEKWTIYVFPGINQDGLKSGWTNNGPGRTTLYSQAPNNQGIDLNRCWQIGDTYQQFNTQRNYNGTEGFQAFEAKALRDFLLENKSEKGQTILIDLHGWTQQLIGDPTICSYFEKQFPENDKSGIGRYGTGYLVNWARTYLGSETTTAKSALIELPKQGVTGHQSVEDQKFADRYITATMEMLKSIDSTQEKTMVKLKSKKAESKYEVALAGIDAPKEAGIWIFEKDRHQILEMLEEITNSEYKIDENGYLKISNKNNQNENDKKLEKVINGNKLYIIRNSSTCYIIDEITKQILDFNFEKLDKYQTYEYFKEDDKMIIFMNENTEKQMTSKEIMQSVIDLI